MSLSFFVYVVVVTRQFVVSSLVSIEWYFHVIEVGNSPRPLVTSRCVGVCVCVWSRRSWPCVFTFGSFGLGVCRRRLICLVSAVLLFASFVGYSPICLSACEYFMSGLIVPVWFVHPDWLGMHFLGTWAFRAAVLAWGYFVPFPLLPVFAFLCLFVGARLRWVLGAWAGSSLCGASVLALASPRALCAPASFSFLSLLFFFFVFLWFVGSFLFSLLRGLSLVLFLFGS